MAVGTDFWWILAPSWETSWDQVGSKIDKDGVKDDIQKKSRNKEG